MKKMFKKSEKRLYLAIGPAVVVDVGGRSQPQLSAVLSAWVHDWEVVLAGDKEGPFLGLRQFGNAPYQQGDVLSLGPRPRRRDLGSHLVFLGVAVAGLDGHPRTLVEHI